VKEGKRGRGEEGKRGRGEEGKRERGKEGKRERGKEGKRERGEEGKRERGKEGKRERGKEGKRERGKEGKRGRGEEGKRGRGEEGKRGSDITMYMLSNPQAEDLCMASNKGFSGLEYFKAFTRLRSNRAVAQEFGVNESTVRRSIEKLDEGIKTALLNTDLSVENAQYGWRKIGTDSVFWRMPEPEQRDLTEHIAKRMERLPAAPPIRRPKETRSDLMNFIPWYDFHLGMRTGSYGTADAVDRIRSGTRDVLDRAPRAETLILLNGGDFTEANDNSALTPTNKHPLAVDKDFEDLSDVAVDLTIEEIEYGLTVSDRVIYQALKANHDPQMSLIIRQALRQRYRDNPRFELRESFDIFVHEWEGNLIAGLHGHQKVSKAETLALAIANRYPLAWGRTTQREIWRGHNHKEVTLSVPGLKLYQVDPICPPGRYAQENLFEGESSIQCVTYGKGGGRRSTTKHIF
jgi:hypothetical protein